MATPGPRFGKFWKHISTPRFVLFGVLILTTAAYIRTLGFDFVYDDHLQIVTSPAVHSWRYLPHYFTTHVWQQSQPGAPPTYYRPVFLLWLLINYTLFGLEPFWWHLTTIAMHLAATGMAYAVVRRLSGDWTMAAFASLIFGLHPAHIEAIAWVSGITEPLLAVLILSSFLCYIKWHQENVSEKRRLTGWFAGSVVLFAFALFEKESAVVFPIVIFAHVWIFRTQAEHGADMRRNRFKQAILDSAPYLALALGYLTVRAVVLNGLRMSIAPLKLSSMVLTLPSVLVFYVKHLILPLHLSPFYDTPYVAGLSLVGFVLPTFIVIGSAVALYLWSKQSRLVAFASIWMVVWLAPVLNLKAFGPEELVHDRYLYLPSMGFSILVAIAIQKIRIARLKIVGRPAEQVAAILIIAGLFAVGTVVQSKYWENNIVLFRRAVCVAPENSLAKHSLAIELGTLGMYSEAIPLLQEVLERRPRSFEANAAIGRYWYSVGAFDQAEIYLSRALQLRPRISRIPYAYLGLARMELGRLDSAEAIIRDGLKVEPLDGNNGFIRGALGLVLERRGELAEALEQFRLELAINPQSSMARNGIAKIAPQLQRNE